MSYAKLPADVREAAERVLTRKQLDVFKLWCANASFVRIALMLDISETRARAIARRANQKIKIELERKEAA